MDARPSGLPPAARQRVDRQRASGTAGSLFSAPAAAAARSAGLAAVGEVFGCLVMNLGWQGGTCGVYGYPQQGLGPQAYPGAGGSFSTSSILAPLGRSASGAYLNSYNYVTPVVTSRGTRGNRSGFGPYVKAYEKGWHGALDRMLAEAAALGAEGVVGVKITRTKVTGQAWEFSAVGTAVRSTDATRVPRPAHAHGEGLAPSGVWAAGFSVEDCAAAILSGWVPRGIALGFVVATKHEDWPLKQQRSSWSNTEVDGLSTLLQTARDEAREQLTSRAGPLRGTDVVITASEISEFETPCGQEKDFHAEAMFVGTVLAPGPVAPFRASDRLASASVLPVISLKDPGSSTKGSS